MFIVLIVVNDNYIRRHFFDNRRLTDSKIRNTEEIIFSKFICFSYVFTGCSKYVPKKYVPNENNRSKSHNYFHIREHYVPRQHIQCRKKNPIDSARLLLVRLNFVNRTKLTYFTTYKLKFVNFYYNGSKFHQIFHEFPALYIRDFNQQFLSGLHLLNFLQAFIKAGAFKS